MKRYLSLNIAKQLIASLLTFALLVNSAFAATYVVDKSNGADTGGACDTPTANDCSIFDAVRLANVAGDADTINFDANGRTITPGATLTISSPMTIDGTSSGAGNFIQLDGNDGAYSALTLDSNSDGSTVKGLFIYDFGSSGITIASGADSITIGSTVEGAGNVIGLQTDGSTADGNTGKGITSAGTNVTILGNYIGSNTGPGIGLTDGSKDVTIKLNTIGSAIGSDTARGNAKGIDIDSTTTLNGGDGGVEGIVIGGDAETDGNTIVSSSGDGIHIGNGAGTVTGNIYIKGNKIGIGDQGGAMGNGSDGIEAETDATAADITIGPEAADDATEANEIGSNTSKGVNITEADDLVVAGNLIGLNSAGTARGNGAAGIQVGSSTAGPNTVLIGSDNADAAEINTIGNNGASVVIDNATTINMAGNYIGLNSAGAGSHANTGAGIIVGDAGGEGGGQITTLTIGGNGTAAAARNFIANGAGGGYGALVVYNTVSGATVNIKANIIGLAANLLTAAANAQTGMYLRGAANYTVGSNGDGTNDSTEYNVVSNGPGDGILVTNGPLTANISGNIVGLASSDGGTTFTVAAGNGTSAPDGSKNGIKISSNSLTSLTIGGALAAQRNVIGSNPEDGINITDAGAAIGCTLQNNYIGVASDGSTSRANTGAGMDIDDCGAITLTDNVVANNGTHGIDIAGGTSLVARGNMIGTIATGLTAAGNNGAGILIAAANMASVIIGGSTAGQGNVISGQISGVNNGFGVNITTLAATTSAVSFLGNYIGVGSDGTTTTNMDNDDNGIRATTGAITVGGDNDLANSLLAGGNVISNNGDTGVFLTDNVSSAAVYGNIIGLKKDGDGVYNTAAGNAGDGFEIDSGVTTSILIGAANGTTVASRRNIISSNGSGDGGNEYGISLDTPGPGPSGAETIKIKNNYIGTDITGALARPNYNSGVAIQLAGNAFVGSELDGANDADEGNLISGNGSAADGMQPGAGITLTGTIGTIGIYGNTIGMNAAKTAALANQAGGINIDSLSSASTITIGSTATGGRNYISGNAEAVGTSGKGGIQVGSSNAAGTVLNVVGNYIGTNGAGDAAISNGGGGLKISDTSSRVTTTVGDGTTAGRNLISGNIDGALDITGGNITINNNLIGVAANGTTALANGNQGQIYAENAIGTSNISYLKISNNVINNLTTVGVMFANIISWNETNSYLESDNSWLSRINGTTAPYNYWSRLVGATLTAYAPKVCYDYLDNDNDGIADWSTGLHDIGCENPQDNDEYNDAGGGGGGSSSSSSSSSSAASSGASTGTAQTGTSAADSNAGQAEAADSTDTSSEDSGVPPGAVGSDEDSNGDSDEDSSANSAADAMEQSKIDRSLLENQNVRRYIVSEKLAEAVNTVGDLVTGKDRVNLEILLSDAAEEVAKIDQIEVVLTDDQQVVSDAALQVARGEDLSEQQVARVERTFEAVVTQSVQRLLEEKEVAIAASGVGSGGGIGREGGAGAGSGTNEGPVRGDQGFAVGDAAGRAAAVIPVRAANGRIMDIDRETQVQFVMDGKKAADLQEIASARGEKTVYLTSYTPVGESDVSAMLEISEGGQVGDPDAGQKIFLGGLRGLSAKSVRDLQPEKPSFTNLIEGVELAQKSVIYVAGPKPGEEVTVFVIDKADSIDPNDWKIWEIGTYELDETGKVAVELDFTDKMAGDIKNFELLVQNKGGEGSVREIIVNKAVEVKMDSVMLRDGKEVIPANLASDGDFSKNLKTNVLLAAETLKQERSNDDRMVLTGYAEPGSVVFVSWESVLLSSAVIADASQGYFEVDVPKKLAKGEHKVLTYAYNKPKKMASHYNKVQFRK